VNGTFLSGFLRLAFYTKSVFALRSCYSYGDSIHVEESPLNRRQGRSQSCFCCIRKLLTEADSLTLAHSGVIYIKPLRLRENKRPNCRDGCHALPDLSTFRNQQNISISPKRKTDAERALTWAVRVGVAPRPGPGGVIPAAADRAAQSEGRAKADAVHGGAPTWRLESDEAVHGLRIKLHYPVVAPVHDWIAGQWAGKGRFANGLG
jgi:hypothetical protein